MTDAWKGIWLGGNKVIMMAFSEEELRTTIQALDAVGASHVIPRIYIEGRLSFINM